MNTGNPDFFDPERAESAGLIVEIDLGGKGPPVFIDHAFSSLEIKIDNDPDIPHFEVVSGLEWPQVRARYIITQPEVLDKDPRQGWTPVGDLHPDDTVIGLRENPQFSFSTKTEFDKPLFLFCAYETYLSLTSCGPDVKAYVPIGSLLTAAEASARPPKAV